MNLAVIGYGRMGRAVRAAAIARGHGVRTIDPRAEDADFAEITPEALEGVEVCLEFTRPGAAAGNLLRLAALGKDVVCGTTGWHDRFGEVKAAVEAAGTGLLHGANFSPGVHLFFRVVRRAAELFAPFPGYDAAGFEIHHRGKADSPSGTARRLAEILLEVLPGKERALFDRPHRPVEAGELHFASLRAGANPGVHAVLFDGEGESVRIEHVLRDRSALAAGAVRGAEWLRGRRGVFTVEAFMEDLVRGKAGGRQGGESP